MRIAVLWIYFTAAPGKSHLRRVPKAPEHYLLRIPLPWIRR